MRDLTIADRVKRAGRALRSPYLTLAHDWDPETEQRTALVDLLADLRHWADARGVDWHEALCGAYGHYWAEKSDAPQNPQTKQQ